MSVSITLIPKMVTSFYDGGLGTIVFRSAPGIGKTEQVRAAKTSLSRKYGVEFGFIEEHLASRSEVDLRGYLIPDGGNATYTKPDFWKEVEKHEHGILFLDELFQCSAEMQKALSPLLLERRIGNYTLPAGWMVVGATNGVEHRSGVTPALSHVTNRICIVDVAPPTAEELAAYYVNKGMPAEVVALVLKSPGTVLGGTPTVQGMPWCSPRTMEKAGHIINQYASAHEALTLPVPESMIRGYIGEAALIDLQAIAKLADSLPLLSDIVADPQGTRVPDTVDKQWLMASMLGIRTDKTTFAPVFDYLQRFPSNIAFIGLYSCWRRGVAVASPAVSAWVIANDELMTVLSGG